MNPLVITTLIAFVAGVALIIAVGMAVRDVTVRRMSRVNRRSSARDRNGGPSITLREPEVEVSEFDDWFYRLVSESGAGLDVASGLALIIGAGIVAGALGFVITDDLLVAGVGMLLGVSLPVIVLAFMRWRRLRAMRAELPEALQIVADSVRVGRNLERSAELAATELRGPLKPEFEKCAAQLGLGNSPTQVMEQMAREVPLPEFRIFATAVMVHQTAGGNLALLTERLSHAARERQEFHGHLNAVTAGSRLSAFGLVIGSIIAMGSLAWMEPDYVSAFYYNDMGPTLLLCAIGLQMAGVIWVWRILKVNY